MSTKNKGTKAPKTNEPKISVRKLTIKTNVKAQQSRGYGPAAVSN